MTNDTIEDIKKDIQRLDAQIKADRLARGVPQEPPADFVSVAMAWTLYERCQPLHEFAIKYVQICDRANQVAELSAIQIKWAQSFRPYTELICKVKDSVLLGVLGGALGGLISNIEKHADSSDADDLLRQLVMNLSFLKGEYHPPRLGQFVWKYNASKEENDKHIKEVYAEYERLKDDEYFEAEYKRLRNHYESIKHLY